MARNIVVIGDRCTGVSTLCKALQKLMVDLEISNVGVIDTGRNPTYKTQSKDVVLSTEGLMVPFKHKY